MKRSAILVVLLVVFGAALALLARRGGRGGSGGGADDRGSNTDADAGARSMVSGLLGGSAREKAQSKLEEGQALEQLERFDEAARAYQQAIDADTTFAAAHLRLGALRLISGQPDSARAGILRAVGLDPASADAQFHHGFLLEEDGDWDGAERAYREAVRLDTTFADAYNNLGHLLVGRGRADAAVAVLEDGRRRAPDSPFLAKNLGRAYERVGMWEKAKPLVEKSLELTAHDPLVLVDVACLRRATGHPADAARFLRQYAGLERDPAKRAAADSLFALAAPPSPPAPGRHP